MSVTETASRSLNRSGREATTAVQRVTGALLAGVMAGLGGLAMTSAFRLSDLVRPVAAAAVVAVVVSVVVTGVLSARLAVSVVVAVPVLVAAAAVACGGGPADVRTGLIDGWRRILETAGVAPPDAVLLVLPFALTAVAAFLGAEVVQRTTSAAGPVVPSLVVLGVGLAFGFDGRLPPAWLPVAWAALAAVAVGLRARRPSVPRPAPEPAPGLTGAAVLRPPRRSFVGAAVTVLVVALPAAGVAHAVAPRLPGLDGRDRVSLRDRFVQQTDDVDDRNPLDLMVELRSGDDTVQFSAETSSRVERWRVAALDTYDGMSWGSSGDFRPAGDELQPPAATSEGDVARVTQTVSRGAWEGPWLPVADRAVEVDVVGVEFDPAAGVLRTGGGGLPPRTYTVESVVPLPDGALLAAAGAAQDAEAREALQLPDDPPDELVAAAEEATAGTGSAYAMAAAIERYLTSPDTASPFELADDAPGGVNAYNVACFVAAEPSEESPECGGRRGTTEQFVTAFALMARHAELPTRVVVGFDGAGPAGPSDVTAHAATAWVEVKFEGVGWVAFDPVPDADTVTESTPAVPTGGQSEETPATTLPPQSETAASAGGDEDPAGAEDSDGGSGLLLWLGAGLGVLAVVVALPGVVRRGRRRRRRAGATPTERIVGAWNNAVDQLRTTGLAVTQDRSVTDVVVAGQSMVSPAAADSLAPLGRLANVARFAPTAPDATTADEAWNLSDRFTTESRKTQSLHHRLRHYFHLRN